MAHLKEGSKAPAFALQDQDGKTVKLADFKGRKLLVYFYPKADTPGCTTQSCSVRDSKKDLAKLGVAVVGISPDKPSKQLAFDQKYGLGFPLLSDADHTVAEKYGVWGEKKYRGRTYMGVSRSTFIIDAEGKLAKAIHGVKPDGHPEQVLDALP